MAKNMLKSRKAFVACSGGSRNHHCSDGCMACSGCIEACKKEAIFYNENGAAEVDAAKCIGCGLCVKACPQDLIHLRNEWNPFFVRCSGHLKGSKAKEACEVSCIQCGLCAKNCPADAISVDNGAAVIHEQRCLSCGNCVVKCPRGTIKDARNIIK